MPIMNFKTEMLIMFVCLEILCTFYHLFYELILYFTLFVMKDTCSKTAWCTHIRVENIDQLYCRCWALRDVTVCNVFYVCPYRSISHETITALSTCSTVCVRFFRRDFELYFQTLLFKEGTIYLSISVTWHVKWNLRMLLIKESDLWHFCFYYPCVVENMKHFQQVLDNIMKQFFHFLFDSPQYE